MLLLKYYSVVFTVVFHCVFTVVFHCVFTVMFSLLKYFTAKANYIGVSQSMHKYTQTYALRLDDNTNYHDTMINPMKNI